MRFFQIVVAIIICNYCNSQNESEEFIFGDSNKCGSWQSNYKILHSAIKSKSLPPRFVVVIPTESGLADNLVGLISAFFYALLSNRSILFYSYDGLMRYDYAFEQASINWTSPPFPNEVIEPFKNTYKGKTGSRVSRDYNYSQIDQKQFYPIFLVNDSPNSDRLFKHSNLTSIPAGNEDVAYVVFSSNRGRSFSLFENNFHKEKLTGGMGLTPERAFSCAFTFLFRPSSLTASLYRPLWRQLTDPSLSLKIGIRIRVGDSTFSSPPSPPHPSPSTQNGGAALVEKYRQYFRCAELIELNYSSSSNSSSVKWYLISDSLELRIAAKREFGDKLITDTSTASTHTYCSTNCSSAAYSMAHAAGDMLSLSLTDYQVFTRDSGFGLISGWIGGKNNMFSIHRGGCGFGNQSIQRDELRDSAKQWAGI
jgi:hypothetical protein